MPWCLGKAFDTACPVSRFVSKSELPNPENVRIFSKVNNKMEQVSHIYVFVIYYFWFYIIFLVEINLNKYSNTNYIILMPIIVRHYKKGIKWNARISGRFP